ncbi:hypothetical protein T484DRAFT_1828994, partial [Baffinella frigidus]
AVDSGLSFSTRVITHSSSMAGARNVVTLKLAPGAILAVGTEVEIDCLPNILLSGPEIAPGGTREISLATNLAPRPDIPVIFDETVAFSVKCDADSSCNQTKTRAQLQKELQKECLVLTLTASFEIQNGEALVGEAKIRIVASAIITIKQTMCSAMDNSPSRCAPTNAMVIDKLPGFLADPKIGTTSTTLDEDNRLSITLRPNIELTELVDISISGLKNTDTPNMALLGGVSHRIAVVSWDKNRGELVVRAKSGEVLNSAAEPDVSFTLPIKNSRIVVAAQNVSLELRIMR